MSHRVLIDTGPLVALLSKQDQHHAACVAAAKGLPQSLCTSLPVLTEASLLVTRYGGLSPRTVLNLVHHNRLAVLPLDCADLLAIGAIVDRYAEHGFSLADASLMHLADRERIDEVFTIDRKDFSLFRTSAGRSLQLIG